MLQPRFCRRRNKPCFSSPPLQHTARKAAGCPSGVSEQRWPKRPKGLPGERGHQNPAGPEGKPCLGRPSPHSSGLARVSGERLGFLPATIPPMPPTLLFFPFSLWALSCEHRNLNLAKTLWGRHRKETEEAANQQRKAGGHTSPPPLAGESNRQEKSRILPLSSWRHTSLGKSLFNVSPSPQPGTKSPLSQARPVGKRRPPEQGWPPCPGGALARSRVSRGRREGTNQPLPAPWETNWQGRAGREEPAAPCLPHARHSGRYG